LLRRFAPRNDETLTLAHHLRFAFFAVFFFEALRFFEAFFGTFLPLALASDNPIAIACLRLLTFLPERPLFSVPDLRFSSRVQHRSMLSSNICVPLPFSGFRLVKSNHRWHAKFLARHSPLALTGDGRHFGRRGRLKRRQQERRRPRTGRI
jgi:hypothetical protein